jgi:hypothetical protein
MTVPVERPRLFDNFIDRRTTRQRAHVMLRAIKKILTSALRSRET